MSGLNADSTVVIIGAGQAGSETAAELRRQGFAGRAIILGEEAHPPYKRPPLSKGFLSGAVTEESLYVMQPAQFDKAGIELRRNAKVTHIHRKDKTLRLADGEILRYDKLVIATGGRARPLSVPGAEAGNVFTLRTIADVQRIRSHCAAGGRVVIIGGGFIGLESAAVMIKMGLRVTLLEGLPRVLARVTVPEMSAFFERVHRGAGVDLRTGVQIAGFEGAPANAVTLADGTRIEADFVVVGIGLIANTELADAAGLTIDNGIVVDAFGCTSDPDIYAAGDCTNHPSAFLGRNVRLESVQNAMEQGRAVAHNLLGKNQPYRAVPWFWSDQYELKLQMVGLSGTHDRMVMRGDPATRNFAVFYLKDGRLIAADTVSRPHEFMFAKKLVAEGAAVDPARLADDSIPFKSLATPAV